jgi:hypothetical protein
MLSQNFTPELALYLFQRKKKPLGRPRSPAEAFEISGRRHSGSGIHLEKVREKLEDWFGRFRDIAPLTLLQLEFSIKAAALFPS